MATLTPTPQQPRDWLAVLNYLARSQNLGAEAAVNSWAGLTGNKKQSVVGALNIIAGNGTNPAKWVGLETVCNQLAGTKNLPPLEALRILANAGGGV